MRNFRGLHYDEDTNTLWLVDTSFDNAKNTWDTAVQFIDEDAMDNYVNKNYAELDAANIDCEMIFIIAEEMDASWDEDEDKVWEPVASHAGNLDAENYHKNLCNFYTPNY